MTWRRSIAWWSGAAIPLAPIARCQHDPPLRRDPRPWHGDCGRPKVVERCCQGRTSGCRWSPAPTVRWPVRWAHVLLTEGLWSASFVGDFKDGRNQFAAGRTVDEAAFAEKETFGLVKWWNIELKDCTPAWAEKECGIPAAQIVKVARAMAKSAPKTAVWMGRAWR